ncbi:MAG: GGDEF domain-containing protein [Aquamicrobium sp.]|uniref:GGDEF domain-containing protein n=1 Tax=Aquamicrobium sp. TaxID=1872579 RepID=UPI00349EE642|nr:GGDEF domain-containing protein [Aquamicrobium sp.]
MKKVLAKATLTAILSATASLLLVLTIVPAIGGVVEGSALLMAVFCTLAIALPGSAYTFLQKKKLADALGEVTAAHERLARAHAELAHAHAQLAEKARHDDMTGLLNRESFFTALKGTRRRSDTGVMLIIDADHFKYINDTHGHAQRDVALLMIAEAIRSGVRAGDIVGRIGGEEFAAFLSGATQDEALIVAERIRLGVEGLRFSPGEGKYLPLSVSIGAARLRPHLSWSQLMREADSRLYEAKARGRNRVVFENPEKAAA